MISIKELRIKTQNSHPNWNNQPKDLLFPRFFSIYITWVILHTSITPNTITISGILFAILSSYLIIENHLLLASFCIFITVLLDFSDGEVSRYKNQSSMEGIYLDKVYDFMVRPIIISGVVIYYIIANQTLYSYITGFIFVISALIYPLVVEYAKTITINDNILKQLDRMNQISKSKHIDIEKKESLIKINLKKLLSFYDFPNIFFLLILVLLINNYFTEFAFLKFDMINFYISLYSFTYPLIIMLFIFNNVKHKRIENEFHIEYKKTISKMQIHKLKK